MGIKDKVRNSLTGPISTMQNNNPQADTNYFVQLDTKYDYPNSPENGHMEAYDAKGPDFSYPAEYGVGQVPYGGGAGEDMQFGGSYGMQGMGQGGGGAANEEFEEYLQLMVLFR